MTTPTDRAMTPERIGELKRLSVEAARAGAVLGRWLNNSDTRLPDIEAMLTAVQACAALPDALAEIWRLREERQWQPPPCEWKMNADGYWDTACGQAFVTEDGGSAAEHSFKFCCYCGGTLIDVPYVEPYDAGDDDTEDKA